MQEAGVPERKLGPYSRARKNAIEVEKARANLPRDILGNRNDRDDPTGVLTDPQGPLADLLVEMGYREADETEPPGSSSPYTGGK